MRSGQGVRAFFQGATVHVHPSTFSGEGVHTEPKKLLKRKHHIPQALLSCPLTSVAFAFMNILHVTSAFENASLDTVTAWVPSVVTLPKPS